MHRWLVAAACVVLLGGGFALANEVGNNPDGTGWRWDFGFDRSEREIELDAPALTYMYEYPWQYDEDYYGTDTYSNWIGSFDGKETLDKYFLKGGYGWGDRYVLYFTLGMARMATEAYDPIVGWIDESYEYYYGEEYYWGYEEWDLEPPIMGRGDWDPFYGAGFKMVFHDSGGFKVGMDLQWNQYKLDNDTLFYSEYNYKWWGDPLDPSWDEWGDEHRVTETDTTEYQLALVFSKKNQHVHPYGGIKLSQWETDYTGRGYYWDTYGGDSRQVDLYEETYHWMATTKQTDNVGLFLGIDCEMTDNFLISGEVRVGDESATTVRMSWKF